MSIKRTFCSIALVVTATFALPTQAEITAYISTPYIAISLQDHNRGHYHRHPQYKRDHYARHSHRKHSHREHNVHKHYSTLPLSVHARLHRDYRTHGGHHYDLHHDSRHYSKYHADRDRKGYGKNYRGNKVCRDERHNHGEWRGSGKDDNRKFKHHKHEKNRHAEAARYRNDGGRHQRWVSTRY